MANLVIMDIDRCVLDPSARIGHYLSGDIDTYEAMWETDKPIPQGLYIYRTFLNDPQWKCLFITSRREWARDTTMQQLWDLFGDVEFELLMRPVCVDKGSKNDAEIKPWLLKEHGYDVKDVFIAFDDRQDVVDEWRRLGVVCYQTDVDPGT